MNVYPASFALLFSTTMLASCGNVTILGMTPSLISPQKVVDVSRYDDIRIVNISDSAMISEYMELIKSTEGKIVEDEHGVYFHRIFGSRIASFSISKNLGDIFRLKLIKSKLFMAPMYRTTFRNDLPEGKCGYRINYDQGNTKKWINNLNGSRLDMIPIGYSDQSAKVDRRMVDGIISGENTITHDQYKAEQLKATGGGDIFVTDSSSEEALRTVLKNKRADWTEVWDCSSSNAYTSAARFRLIFLDKAVIDAAAGTSAHGVISAKCAVTDWSTLRRNAGGQYVNFPTVEKQRLELESIAFDFCKEAIEKMKISGKLKSLPLS